MVLNKCVVLELNRCNNDITQNLNVATLWILDSLYHREPDTLLMETSDADVNHVSCHK